MKRKKKTVPLRLQLERKIRKADKQFLILEWYVNNERLADREREVVRRHKTFDEILSQMAKARMIEKQQVLNLDREVTRLKRIVQEQAAALGKQNEGEPNEHRNNHART